MSQKGLQFEEDDVYDVSGVELGELSLAEVDAALRNLSENLDQPGELDKFEALSMVNEQLLFHDGIGAEEVAGYETSAGDLYDASSSLGDYTDAELSDAVAMKRVAHTREELRNMREFMARAEKLPEVTPQKLLASMPRPESGEDYQKLAARVGAMSPLERKWVWYQQHPEQHPGATGIKVEDSLANQALFSGAVPMQRVSYAGKELSDMRGFLQRASTLPEVSPEELVNIQAASSSAVKKETLVDAASKMSPLERKWLAFRLRSEGLPRGAAGLMEDLGTMWRGMWTQEPKKPQEPVSEDWMLKWFLWEQSPPNDNHPQDLLDALDLEPGSDAEQKTRRWSWMLTPAQLDYAIFRALRTPPHPVPELGRDEEPLSKRDLALARIFLRTEHNLEDPGYMKLVNLSGYNEEIKRIKRDMGWPRVADTTRLRKWLWLKLRYPDLWRYYDEERPTGLGVPEWDSALHNTALTSSPSDAPLASEGWWGTSQNHGDVARVLVSTVRGLKKASKLDTTALRNQKPWQYHVVNEDRWGDGPGKTRNLVVFIHGINAKEPVWTQQALGLAAKVKDTFPYAYFPHIKQHKNGKLKNYTEPVVRGILEYLQTYGTRVKKIMIVGISNGGRIALEVEWNLRSENLQDPAFRQEIERNGEGQDVMRIQLPQEVKSNPPQLFVVTVASPLGGTKSASAVPKFISRRIYGDAFLEEVEVGGKESNALVQRAIYANDRLPNVLFAHFYFSKDYMVWPGPSSWINEQLAFNLGAEAHHLVQQNPLVLSLLGKFAFYFANFEGDDLGDLSQFIDNAVPKTFERGQQHQKK